jgi:WhiB family transcriptional regulator, redox-sensing transcriptional regulator
MGEGRLDKARREGRAKAICAACPVRKDCLDYAIATHEPHGVWGGLNELERRPLWV